VAVIMVEERFDPPIDLSQGSPVADKVSPCLPVYDVTWMSSYIASDGSRCVCVYEAEDAEASTSGRRARCITPPPDLAGIHRRRHREGRIRPAPTPQYDERSPLA
jgi:hypothetical protein